MLRKVTALAILIAVVLASFPTTGVLATGVTAKNLEDKWDQYVKAVDHKSFVHNKIDAKVDKWLSAHKDAKSDIRTHLTNDLIAYHTNLSAAKAIIQERAGFNAKGKVIDVSNSKLWKTGVHMKRHSSGTDLTVDIEAAPHGPEVLGRYPQVGVLKKKEEAGSSV